jgi:hypothetical protein
MRVLITVLAAVCLLSPASLSAQWQASVSAQGSAFRGLDSGGYPGPSPTEAVVALDASLVRQWAGGRYALRATPSFRWDPSGERTRVDLRDLNLSAIGAHWEFSVGMKEIFWGATESRRLVDGVNQRDLVGGGEAYARMGQLMADVTVFSSWGTIDVLLLPWFRERTFDGHSGLLWSPLPVDADRPVYGPGARTWRPDWAVRWTHTLGPVDLGLSHLQGTLREPGFVETTNDHGRTVLAPRYDVGGQTGLDLQVAAGGLIWKLETLIAEPQPGRYVAAAGGIEYGVGDFLALFLEYAWDSRGREATTSFGDDVFVGGRLFLPDGQVNAGVYVDRQSLNTAPSVAVDWRVGNSATIGLEAGAFLGDSALEPALGRRQQTRLSVRFTRYF